MGFFDKLFRRKKVMQEKKIFLEREDSQLSQIATTEKQRGMVIVNHLSVDDAVAERLLERVIAFDVETTGLSAKSNRIIEIGAVLFENGEESKRYSTLVDAGVNVPPTVTAINHITNEMLLTAPREKFVYPEFLAFLGDALEGKTMLCAHNARFDMDFLSETLMRLGYDATISCVDTLALSRKMLKLRSNKLNTVAQYFGIENEQAHHAVADAEVCGKILQELLKLKKEQQKQHMQYLEESSLDEEEMETCAYIQKIIADHEGDLEFLGFSKNKKGYIDVIFISSIFKIKFMKKRRYILAEKRFFQNSDLEIEPCSKTEGTEAYVRVFFQNPFQLENVAESIWHIYKEHYDKEMYSLAMGYLTREDAVCIIKSLHTLSVYDVVKLLQRASGREEERLWKEKETERIAAEQQKEREKKAEEKKKAKEEKKEEEKKNASAGRKSLGRPVLQMTDDLVIIARYESIAEAIRETGINSKSIRDAAKGVQKHAGGYVWKYEDEQQL